LTSEQFVEFLKKVDFDLIECLYDDQNATNGESKKRAKKAYDRTQNFVESFFTKESSVLEKVDIENQYFLKFFITFYLFLNF
jgi:hypothetical protein